MFTRYRLVDHRYKTIYPGIADPLMHSPLPAKDDFIVLGRKLYKVTCLFFFHGESPVVQVVKLDFPPPRELVPRVPRTRKPRVPV